MSAPTNHCALHSASTHIFLKPTCEQLGTIKKIIIIVGHILTGGIFFFLARVISYFSGTENLTRQALQSVRSEYPENGRQAIEFALTQLDRFPYRKHHDQWCVSYENPLASRLFTIAHFYRQKWYNAALAHHEDPWHSPEVLLAADNHIKMLYAIACLALEDLAPAAERTGRTHAQQLVNQEDYHCFAFLRFTEFYNSWCKCHIWSDEIDGEVVLRFDRNQPSSHVPVFYWGGTLQSKWRRIYNDFCQRANQIPGLMEADERFPPLIQPDLSPT